MRFGQRLLKLFAMNTLTISLPEDLRAWVENAAQESGYASAGDYVRELVRENRANVEDPERERKKAELIKLLDEGLASKPIVVTPQWWAQFRQELEQDLKDRGIHE